MKKSIKLIVASVIVLVLPCLLSATQRPTRTVKGVVSDAYDGLPIIGADVRVVGTANGDVTNIDGEYTIHNVPIPSTLIASYFGYISQTRPVTSNPSSIHFSLSPNITNTDSMAQTD